MSDPVPNSPPESRRVPYQRRAEVPVFGDRAAEREATRAGPPSASLAADSLQIGGAGQPGNYTGSQSRPHGNASKGPGGPIRAEHNNELLAASWPPRANLPSPAPANLAEVIDRLSHVDTLTKSQLSCMRSALKCVAQVVGRPLAEISTDIGMLRGMFADAIPANGLVRVNRWTRARSLTLAALRATGVQVMPGRMPNGLSPAWQELFEKLPDRRCRLGLSRLLKFCTSEGIEPQHFCLDTFARFAAAVTETSLRLGGKHTQNIAGRLWNTAAASVPGWPTVTATIKPDTRKYSVARDSLPMSFYQDVDGFLQSSGNPSPFHANYAKPVRPGTIEVRRRIIMQLASALVHSGKPAGEIIGLKTLTAPVNAEAILQYLYNRNGEKTMIQIGAQANLLALIARHWVHADTESVNQLSEFARNLTPKRQPEMTERNRTRLRQFDLPSNLQRLYSLAEKIRQDVERHDDGKRQTAVRVMFALAVELLSVVPMRVDDLCGLQIGRHLIEQGHGRERKRFISIAGPETAKNGPPISGELGLKTTKLLDLYCSIYRKRLCDLPGDFLFPGRFAGKRAVTSFSSGLSAFIYHELGLKVHSHLFRHLCAKVTLDHDSNDIESVRQLLRHRSIATTLRHYAEFSTAAAMKRHENLLNSLREHQPESTRLKAGPDFKSKSKSKPESLKRKN